MRPLFARVVAATYRPTLLIFSGPLSGGSLVVGLANKCDGNHTIAATFAQIGAKLDTT
jgi:hypothetical protein